MKYLLIMIYIAGQIISCHGKKEVTDIHDEKGQVLISKEQSKEGFFMNCYKYLL